MFKLYRKSQEAQLRWMRNHPVQYVALNAALLVAYFGYIKYKDRQEMRKFDDKIDPQSN